MTGLRSYIVAALIAALGGLEQSGMVNIVPAGYEGGALLVVAAAMFFLRKITNGPAREFRSLMGPRAFMIALALGVAAPALTACASIGSAFEQVQPRTVREGLALAEVTFNGAVATASQLHAAGVISTEDARNEVLPKLEQAARLLDTAQRLMKAGDEAQAGRSVNAVLTLLTELSAELSRRLEESRTEGA